MTKKTIRLGRIRGILDANIPLCRLIICEIALLYKYLLNVGTIMPYNFSDEPGVNTM